MRRSGSYYNYRGYRIYSRCGKWNVFASQNYAGRAGIVRTPSGPYDHRACGEWV